MYKYTQNRSKKSEWSMLYGLERCCRLPLSGFFVLGCSPCRTLTILDYNSIFCCNGPHAYLPIQLNTHEFLRKNGMVGTYGISHMQWPPSRCSQQQPDGGQLIKNLYSDPTDKKIELIFGSLSCFSFFPWGP